MVLFGIRPLDQWFQISLLVLDHLFAPLTLHDAILGDFLEFSLSARILGVGDFFETFGSHVFVALVSALPAFRVHLLLSNLKLSFDGIVSFDHRVVYLFNTLNKFVLIIINYSTA